MDCSQTPFKCCDFCMSSARFLKRHSLQHEACWIALHNLTHGKRYVHVYVYMYVSSPCGCVCEAHFHQYKQSHHINHAECYRRVSQLRCGSLTHTDKDYYMAKQEQKEKHRTSMANDMLTMLSQRMSQQHLNTQKSHSNLFVKKPEKSMSISLEPFYISTQKNDSTLLSQNLVSSEILPPNR